MSQEEFAELLGISQSYLSQLETGKRIASISTLMKISEILHVKIDDLIDKTDGTIQIKTNRGKKKKNNSIEI